MTPSLPGINMSKPVAVFLADEIYSIAHTTHTKWGGVGGVLAQAAHMTFCIDHTQQRTPHIPCRSTGGSPCFHCLCTSVHRRRRTAARSRTSSSATSDGGTPPGVCGGLAAAIAHAAHELTSNDAITSPARTPATPECHVQYTVPRRGVRDGRDWEAGGTG